MELFHARTWRTAVLLATVGAIVGCGGSSTAKRVEAAHLPVSVLTAMKALPVATDRLAVSSPHLTARAACRIPADDASPSFQQGKARVFVADNQWWGCWGRSHRGVLLTRGPGDVLPGPFAASGPVLAYGRLVQEPGAGFLDPGPLIDRVVLVNLRKGRTERPALDGFTLPTPGHPPRPTSLGGVDSISIRSVALAAWIAQSEERTPTEYEVVVSTPEQTRLLAAATNIDSTSLRVSEGTISWTRGGHRTSATVLR